MGIRFHTFVLRRTALWIFIAAVAAALILWRVTDQDARRSGSAVVTTGGGPVFHVDTDRPLMSFAINIDWGQEYLPGMLDVLAEQDVKVTFFPTGRWAKKFPDWMRRLADAGHEIGNHGLEHELPTRLSDARLRELISGGGSLVEELIGKRPTLFAPPSGDWNERVVRHASDLGYTTIMWTLDTIDWQRPAAATIIQRVVPKAAPGAIVLMHPTAPTLQALPSMIRGLKGKGLRLVTISELLRAGHEKL